MLALAIDPDLAEGDLVSANGALSEDLDLQTMVIASVFADAPARDGDDIPTSEPRGGWWGDAFSEVDGDIWGSRLWTLRASKLVAETCRKAESFIEESLAWMLTDGYASSVKAECSIVRRDRKAVLLGYVDITAPSESTPQRMGPWELLRGGA